MMTRADFVDTLAASGAGLTLAELLTQHPDVARRTAQRWISQVIAEGHIRAHGEGRARRYRAGGASSRPPTAQQTPTAATPPWAGIIPISADSRDILAYVEQAIPARKPVGYQQDFLDSYQPNVSGYLSEPLRKRYGVALGVRQCQRIFGQMGFRLRKPRPQVAQSDPVKVAAVKKTAPLGKATGH